MVKIQAQIGDITNIDSEAIVVGLFQKTTSLTGGTQAVNMALEGVISDLITDGEITGKQSETTIIHTLGKLPTKRVIVLGLGEEKAFSSDVLRTVSASMAKLLRALGIRRASSLLHGKDSGELSSEILAQTITEGIILGLYQFLKYRSKSKDGPTLHLDELNLIEIDPAKLESLSRGITNGTTLAESVALVRDMVNEPPNIMHPTRMAEIAEEVAREAGLRCRVLGIKEINEHQMGAILAVTAGSVQEPKLIILEYQGDPDHPENNIALAGKGITFDTGGISLKPALDMGAMKSDMGGGASVIGSLRAIGFLRPRINVFGIIPAVENMPGGSAQRPGDIIRAMNGKTIEVDNTDAEGRLVLADAISYAIHNLGAKRVVDIATLTGAMVVALGHITTGVMGKSQYLVNALLNASIFTGEKMWQMPLFDEYRDQNHSDLADVKNTGGRPAGSITAALFISEFTEGAEWAHLDIAGTALISREQGHLIKGGTGIPMRTLVKLVQDLASGA